MNKAYDIIFMYGFSRIHPYLLTMIKHLGASIRIGILVLDPEKYITADARRIQKLRETEELFIKVCVQAGAEIIDFGRQDIVCSELLLIPQVSFNDNAVLFVKKNIRADKVIGIQGFGYGKNLLQVLRSLGCRKFIVYDKRIFLSVLKKESAQDLVKDIELVEMGAPYSQYPVWQKDEIRPIDYLVAFPTAIFIKTAGQRLILVRNFYELLQKIPAENSVYIKLHNVKDGGNEYIATRWGSPALARIVEKFGSRGKRWAAGMYYKRILRRCRPLETMTPYYNFALELFLPYVRKGVLTGISTVLWHCLYNKTPVYNCDPQKFHEALPNFEGYRNFYIPYCNNSLSFDAGSFSIIPETTRQGDLMSLLKKEMSAYAKKN